MKGLLKVLSSKSSILVADSAIGGKGASALKEIGIETNEDFKNYIIDNTTYTKAFSMGTYDDWYDRELFYFV